jgi:hypothetical protein
VLGNPSDESPSVDASVLSAERIHEPVKAIEVISEKRLRRRDNRQNRVNRSNPAGTDNGWDKARLEFLESAHREERESRMRRSADFGNITEFLVGNDALDIVVFRKRIENVDDLQTLRTTILGKEENHLKVGLNVFFIAGREICKYVFMSGSI